MLHWGCKVFRALLVPFTIKEAAMQEAAVLSDKGNAKMCSIFINLKRTSDRFTRALAPRRKTENESITKISNRTPARSGDTERKSDTPSADGSRLVHGGAKKKEERSEDKTNKSLIHCGFYLHPPCVSWALDACKSLAMKVALP